MLLTACTARLTSTLPAAAAAPSMVGAQAIVLSPLAVDAEIDRLQSELAARVAMRDWGIPVQLSRGADGTLRIRIGADDSFESGTAQFRPGALLLYAGIADVLRAAPAVVTHVLVHGAAPEAGEAAIDLTTRRAATVHSYFAGRGLPATRLRAEGRGTRQPATLEPEAAPANRRVDIVLKAIVAGREVEAWVVPACDPCT